MRKVSSKRIWCLFCIGILIAIGILVGTQSAPAIGGQAIIEPGVDPAPVDSQCETAYYDSITGNRCGGLSWVLKPVDNAHSRCLDIGANMYYQLGWLMYDGYGTNPQYTGNIGRSAVKVKNAVNVGGSIPYRPEKATNGISWEEADTNWQIAKPYAASDSPDWMNTGWFCWNPDWACGPDECPPISVPSNTQDTIYGKGSFWAESYLTVQNEIAVHVAEPASTKDGAAHQSVTIRVSTDNTAYVTFSHKMFYDDELWNPGVYTSPDPTNHPIQGTDPFDEIKTQLKIEQFDWTGNATPVEEDFSTGGSSANNDKEVYRIERFPVSPAPGETLTICQTLSHQSVEYVIEGKDGDHPDVDGNGNPITVHDEWSFSQYSEDGYRRQTRLCAEVYRPADPSGEDPNTWAKNKGQDDEKPMFAGETSEIGWQTRAEWEAARRVRGWQAIAFTVPSDVNYDRNNVTGDLSYRNNVDPCSFYRKAGWGPSNTWCQVIGGREASGDLGKSGTHNYNEAQTIALQDYVGYKYCTSFGYYWEYYYSISYDGADSWQPEGKQYWTHYNAACRTIAKKPSVAYWNSGVLTNGGIKTSLSPRILGVGRGQTAGSNDFTNLYGSWSEHLAVVGGVTTSFGSGASLSRGSSSSVGSYRDIVPRSPMTISNTTSTMGNSGVSTSNTLRTRLNTYLSNRPNIDSINSLPSVITSGTYILNIAGDLTIDRNIIVSGGPYASIYQIPQVVIFVGGKVNITGNVTEIDAWIIAGGELNTCSDFRNGDTQTKSIVYDVNTVCDKQLIFNGPVMADKVYLNRSYGSDPIAYGASSARYTTGEIFNLSGENYLWAYAQAGRYSSSYTEAYSRELAPRY